MGRRRKARECALQILFGLEFNSSGADTLIDHYWAYQKPSIEIKEYGNWLVRGILDGREEIDRRIQSVSEHWRVSRMAVVDRNILRIAVFELLNEKTLVPAIVINEAIEIAKKFSGEQAAVFINGILDGVKKDLEKEDHTGKEGTHVRRQNNSRQRSPGRSARTKKD